MHLPFSRMTYFKTIKQYIAHKIMGHLSKGYMYLYVETVLTSQHRPFTLAWYYNKI